jgi:hypothetical protein
MLDSYDWKGLPGFESDDDIRDNFSFSRHLRIITIVEGGG